MYKGAIKIKAVFLILSFLMASGCGVKTDPIAPETPAEVAPFKAPTAEPTPKKKSIQNE